ncbi:MAG: hypothetical protein AAFY42_06965 [Pseudomonadota bacterium]
MSLTAALLIFAQSAAPQAVEAPATSARPAIAQARASVRIIRPASIDFAEFDRNSRKPSEPAARETQRRRDAAGTPWIEFS